MDLARVAGFHPAERAGETSRRPGPAWDVQAPSSTCSPSVRLGAAICFACLEVALASGQKSSEDLRRKNAFLSDDLIARSKVNLSAIRW